MDERELDDILQLNVLSENNRDIVKRAISKFVNEREKKIRDEVKSELNEDYAMKFHHGQEHMLAAADKMISETLSNHIKEGLEERRKLKEERERLAEAIKTSRREYNKKINEHNNMLESFIVGKLKEEISELYEDKKDLAITKIKLAKKTRNLDRIYEKRLNRDLSKFATFLETVLRKEVNEMHENHKEYNLKIKTLNETIKNEKIESKKKLTAEVSALKEMAFRRLSEQKAKLDETINDFKRKKVEAISFYKEAKEKANQDFDNKINMLETFLANELRKELTEFELDKKDLVDTKKKLISESKQKLKETQKNFINRASELIDKHINTQIRNEFTEMRQDILEARRNNFGRKLYESFYNEFHTNFFNNNNEIKKINESLERLKKERDEALSKVASSERLVETAKQKVKFAEDKARRTLEMNKLLAPLDNEKRKVMESLLSTTKTEFLSSAFNKFLPSVLSTTSNPAHENKTRRGVEAVLNESQIKRDDRVVVEMTGNKKSNTLSGSSSKNNELDLNEVRRLAGIN